MQDCNDWREDGVPKTVKQSGKANQKVRRINWTMNQDSLINGVAEWSWAQLAQYTSGFVNLNSDWAFSNLMNK